MITITEYISEGILSKKTGQYKYIKSVTEKYIRDGIINHLYVNVSSELEGSQDEMVAQLHGMTRGDCLWAEFVDEDSGAIVYFLAGNDDFVAKLVFDGDYPVYGAVYKVKGNKVTIESEQIKESIEYYEKWTKYTPF